MKTPRVSVIMPVYNANAHLTEAVESILTQTFSDFELIIVNDASTDASKEIVAGFSDARIKFIENQTNSGSAFSMNIGIEIARGEYIARMDADDVSLPERLATQVTYLDSHPNVGIVGTWVRVIGDSHEYVWDYESDPEELKARTLFDCRLAFPSVMMRAVFLKKNNLSFNTAWRRAEDYDMWARAATYGSIANIPEVLLKYRLHSAQTSHRFDAEHESYVSVIHSFQLARIGLVPTAEQLRVHRLIANWSAPVSKEEVKQAGEWLVTILKANKQRRFYTQNKLRHVVGTLWYGMLLRGIKFKVVGRRLITQAPSDTLSLSQRLKFVIKHTASHFV